MEALIKRTACHLVSTKTTPYIPKCVLLGKCCLWTTSGDTSICHSQSFVCIYIRRILVHPPRVAQFANKIRTLICREAKAEGICADRWKTHFASFLFFCSLSLTTHMHWEILIAKRKCQLRKELSKPMSLLLSRRMHKELADSGWVQFCHSKMCGPEWSNTLKRFSLRLRSPYSYRHP